MDAKIAAGRVKSGLNNISTSELLELHKSLNGNSEFANEFASLNDYAKTHIAAFGNATSVISLEDAILYQEAINTFGKNEKGELNEESKAAQAKLDKFMAENPEANDLTKEDKEAQDIEYNLFDVKEADLKSNMSFWDTEFKEESLDNNDKAKLKEFNAILGRVKVKDDELGLDSNTYLQRLIEASMLESKFYNLGSPQVAKLNPQEKNKKVFDDFINLALNKISALSIADSIRPAKGKECDPRTAEHKAYMQEYNAKVKHNIGNITSDKANPIVISAQGVITACAETSVKANEFLKRLGEKFKGSAEIKKIQATVNKFDEGCKSVWKNRWEIGKAIVESVRKNKWQVGLGLGGSLAVTGVTIATAAPVAIPVTLGYVAYSTATSWVAPILDEAAGLRKDAKTNGKKMGLFESLKQARKNKANDTSYKRKAAIGTGFAVLGGGLIGASSGILNSVSETSSAITNAVTARVIATVSRVAGSNTSLFVERHFAKKAYKEAPADKKEELRKNLSSANTALTFGLFAGAIATYIGMSNVANANDTAEIANNAFDAASTTPDATEVAPKVVSTVTPEVDMSHVVDKFPSYNSEMGISHAQYNTLLRTRTSEDLIRMYNNLSPEVMENFPDLTKEELLYNYNRLDAFTKIVDARTGVSIDGAKRWHWDAELKDLKAMLECDEKITVAEMTAAKFALSHIQENGDYIGPGDHVRTDFYLKTIQGEPCPKDNVSYYAHGGLKENTPPVVTPPDVAPETPPVVTPPDAARVAPVVTPPDAAPETTPVVTPPDAAPETTPITTEPTGTKYVPLNEKFNVKSEAEHWALLKSKGVVLGEDGVYYIPSKDGTGIELDLVKLSEKTAQPDGTFNVRNAQELIDRQGSAPEATRYVPLDKKYNVMTEAEIMKEFKGKGLVIGEDGRYYIPSKDGKGIEIELTTFSDEAIKNQNLNKNTDFNVRNAQELINKKNQR